jgi:hypothetical protein
MYGDDDRTIRVANSRDLQRALTTIIRATHQPRPSRAVIARQLDRLAAATRTKKAPTKKTPTKPEVVNVSAREGAALKYLRRQVEESITEVKSMITQIRDAVETLEDNAKGEEVELSRAELDAPWDEPGKYFASYLLDPIKEGIGNLASELESNLHITREDDLAKAVMEFAKKLPKEGDWPAGKGSKHFTDVQAQLTRISEKIPEQLIKPSELGKLRECFEAVAKAVKMICGTSVAVPSIPKAPDPENPRQMGFEFTASRARVASPADLRRRLERIMIRASWPNPSREVLAKALQHVADGLT